MAHSQVPNREGAAHWVMDIFQLLITIGAVIGVVLVGLLAIVPSLLDRPAGRDRTDPDEPSRTPPSDHPGKNGVDLAA
ncbi:MAG TPA: hypothetical protein VE476_00055 [Propionibacteriaceae bacterium]|nr:hypothetical protein [Propionibacteriaceae bacterium]